MTDHHAEAERLAILARRELERRAVDDPEGVKRLRAKLAGFKAQLAKG